VVVVSGERSLALAKRPTKKRCRCVGKTLNTHYKLCGGVSKETLDISQKPAHEMYTEI